MEPILIVLVILAFIGLAVLGWWMKEQRRKALAAFAASHGLRFEAGHDASLEDRFPDFDCLRRGSRRYGYNRLRGQWNGREVLAFDYHYATHSTDSKGRRKTHHHHFSAVILRSNLPLRPLLIRPEGFFDKVKDFFGFEDIDFESAEFSRKFFVKSPDRKWAYDVLHTRAMQMLLDSPTFHIQFSTSHVIACRSRTFSVADFAAAAGVIEQLLDGLPEYVVRQQTGRG